MPDVGPFGVWLWVVLRHRRAIGEGVRRGALRHRTAIVLSWLRSAEWREVKRTARFVTYRGEAT